MDQQILEVCYFLVLAADTSDVASDSLCGLFTLVSKHSESPYTFFMSQSTVISHF